VEPLDPKPESPAPIPQPPIKPSISLPSLPPCGSTNAVADLRTARELLSEDRQSALRLFDRVVGCGGQYAMISGRFFDPSDRIEGVSPDARIAMRFYWFAARQGRASDARLQLEAMEGAVEGSAVLVQQIDAMIDALDKD
jgi:hypothetical protein